MGRLAAEADTIRKTHSQRSDWKFPLGVVIFVIGLAAPAAIPVVASSGLPDSWKVVASTALAVGVPEIMMLTAATVMGKEGFAEIKRGVGRFFRHYGPPDRVGPMRYRIGLVMFVAPLLLGWLGPYAGDHLPGFRTYNVQWSVGSDAVFVASLFVLGGDFWDKLHSLFRRDARVVFPVDPS